jgi:uncharacterized phage infection (PIP) family protein YhgE
VKDENMQTLEQLKEQLSALDAESHKIENISQEKPAIDQKRQALREQINGFALQEKQAEVTLKLKDYIAEFAEESENLNTLVQQVEVSLGKLKEIAEKSYFETVHVPAPKSYLGIVYDPMNLPYAVTINPEIGGRVEPRTEWAKTYYEQWQLRSSEQLKKAAGIKYE